MCRNFLSVILMTCMVSSSLCGCSVSIAPPADSVVEGPETEAVLTDLPTTWDLTDIYKDYAAFDADMDRAEELITEVGQFRGTLDSAEGIRNYLESPVNLDIDAILAKAGMYYEFLNALNAADQTAQAAMARL